MFFKFKNFLRFFSPPTPGYLPEEEERIIPREIFPLFGLAFLFSMPALIWHNWPSPDAAVYYLPMIREFTESNWSGVWFSMIPPLFIVLAGLVATVFFLPAILAAKLVSVFFFAASLFPLYRIFKPVYGRRTAWIGCLLMLFCSRLLRNSAAPLLDSTKMFFFLASLALTFETFRGRPLSLHRIAALSIFTACLALSRPEGLIFSILIIGAVMIGEILQPERSGLSVSAILRRLPLRSGVIIVLFILLVTPWALFVQSQIGYPVLDSRQVPFLKKIPLINIQNSVHDSSRAGGDPASTPISDASTILSGQSEGVAKKTIEGKSVDEPLLQKAVFLSESWQEIRGEVLDEFHKGIYQYYIPLYLIGIFMLRKRRQWSRWDGIFALVFLFHGMINTRIFISATGSIGTEARYILPAAPLLFGWAAEGIEEIKKQLDKNGGWLRRLGIILAFIIAGILIYNANHKSFRSLRQELAGESKYATILETAEWLRNKGKNEIQKGRPPLRSTAKSYHPGRRPVVLTANRRLPFLGEADLLYLDHRLRKLTAPELLQYAQKKTVDFIIIDEEWQELSNVKVDLSDLVRSPHAIRIVKFGEKPYTVNIFKVR